MANPSLPNINNIRDIAAEAGQLAMRYFHPGSKSSSENWSKDDGSPVSKADHAVDAFLHDRLRELLPEAGWLSEEIADNSERLNRRYTWIVDPIDGTRDYLRGKDGWCISIALVDSGVPIIGVLYAPANDIFFSAKKGEGAFRNGEKLFGTQRALLEGMRYPSNVPVPNQAHMTTVPCANSIALRIAMLAEDKADALTTVRWGGEWDLAAAHVIADESGLTMSDAAGQPLRYNKSDPRVLGCLVSSPPLHSEMVDKFSLRVTEFLKNHPA